MMHFIFTQNSMIMSQSGITIEDDLEKSFASVSELCHFGSDSFCCPSWCFLTCAVHVCGHPNSSNLR